MKHFYKYLIIIILFIASNASNRLLAQDSTFAFKLNGHKYNQSEDLMIRGIQEWFVVAMDSLDIPGLLDTLAADNGITIDELNIPKTIDLRYQVDISGATDFQTVVTIDTLSITASGLFDCVFEVNITGAGFVLGGVSTYENGLLKIKLGEPDILQSDISVVASGENILCPGLAELFKSGIESQIDSIIIDLASMYESDTFVGLLSFLNPIQALGVEDSVLIDQAFKSFPMQMEVYTEEDLQQGIVQLIVEINFLMGTMENSTAFIGVEPAKVDKSQLYFGGFSFLYWVLQQGFPWHDWSESQRVSEALSKMDDAGFKDFRIELRWSDLQKVIYHGAELNPADISPENISEFLENSDHWYTTAFEAMNEYITTGISRGLQPFMAIGIGHQDRMPLYEQAGSRIAPASEQWSPIIGYTGVSANEYLYNLKIYAQATVRKFADDIDIWQIENELNAAAFAAAVPEWWRKGDLWMDSEFRNQVWDILVEAVRTEDPKALIIHDLHMLGFMEGLEQWIEDMDIVGINYYPNSVNALPLMGFSVGEYVWAVRRALKGLGFEDRQLWVTETGYPGIEINNPPDELNLAEDMTYFSENRQSTYVGSALSSSVKNGVNGFFYYSLVTQDDYPDEIPEPMRYSGMVRRGSDELKPALTAYSNLYKQFLVADPTAIETDITNIPENFSLDQNYPNPFNPRTLIRYQLPVMTDVELTIYNLLGQNVATLVKERQEAGQYRVEWNASGFASGVYYYRLRTSGGFVQFKKLILLK